MTGGPSRLAPSVKGRVRRLEKRATDAGKRTRWPRRNRPFPSAVPPRSGGEDAAAKGSGPPRCRGGRGEAGEYPSTGTVPWRERVTREGLVSVYGNPVPRDRIEGAAAKGERPGSGERGAARLPPFQRTARRAPFRYTETTPRDLAAGVSFGRSAPNVIRTAAISEGASTLEGRGFGFGASDENPGPGFCTRKPPRVPRVRGEGRSFRLQESRPWERVNQGGAGFLYTETRNG